MKTYASKFLLLSAVLAAGAFLTVSMIPEHDVRVTLETEFVKSLYDKYKKFHEQISDERVYVQTDKPMYKPGETIWFSGTILDGKNLLASTESDIMHAELIGPRGNSIKHVRLIAKNGKVQGNFDLGEEFVGGMYKLKAYTNYQLNEGTKHLFEKKFQVQKVVLPNLKMELDFSRKAYGPGDKVSAKLKLNTNANKPLSQHNLRFAASLKGAQFVAENTVTNEDGEVELSFQLPHDLSTSDGLLNAMIQFEGKTESISRSIPIALDNIDLTFFPEGGSLVQGLQSKVAFRALNEFGKPADIEGKVVDQKGNQVAWFSSYHHGMGGFDFTPRSDQQYTVQITKPTGIQKEYALPEALPKGYILNVTSSTKEELELTVSSSIQEQLSLVAQVRGKIYYAKAFEAKKGINRLKMSTEDFPIGVSKITLFDSHKIERAERLVFVNRDKQLKISVETDKEKYLPREKVEMTVTVSDDRGMPMPANLSLAVVNDQLLTFADDKSSNILSETLLEFELNQPVHEPAFYFNKKEEKSSKALDYLLMTSGWRRFTWKVVRSETYLTQNYKAEKTRIFGKVYDAHSGEILKGATVQLIKNPSNQERINEGGTYDFSRVNLFEPVQVMVKADGFQGQFRTVNNYGNLDFSLFSSNQMQYRIEATAAPMEELEMEQVVAVSDKSRRRNFAVANFASAAKKNKKVRREVIDAPEKDVLEPVAERKKLVNRDGAMRVKLEEKVHIDELAFEEDEEEHVDEVFEIEAIADTIFKFDLNGDLWVANEDLDDFKDIQKPGQSVSGVKVVRAREFAAPVYNQTELAQENVKRTDFRSTIYWNGDLAIDRSGKAKVEFYTSDEITSFRATLEGSGLNGSLGRAEHKIFTQLPMSLSAKFPVEVSSGDKLTIPITLKNNTDEPLTGKLKLLVPLALHQVGSFIATHILKPKETKTVYVDYEVGNSIGSGTFEASFVAAGLSDAFAQEVSIVSQGFPVTHSFSGNEVKKDYFISIDHLVEGSITAELNVYPSIVTDLLTGVEGILREPSGCFEQTSTSSYPNIMVMDYLKTMENKDSKVMAKAEGLIDRGYKRLTTFETSTKGYEWFGQSPAHEGLTAYGLMQFNDMKEVYGDVDSEMLERTAQWILSKRDGTGKFQRNTNRQLHNFGRISEDVMNAYITYALCDAGYQGLEKELEYSYNKALETKDPYLMALMSNAMFSAGENKKGQTMLNKLLAHQKEDGSLMGTTHSITYSTHNSLAIETTALSIMAMLQAPVKPQMELNKAVQFVMASRSGYGSFGNTQGTILALKALTAYAKASKVVKEDGIIEFYVDGKCVARQSYFAGSNEPLKLDGLGQYLEKGKNKIRVKFVGVKEALPYSLAISYNTSLPQSQEQCKVHLEQKLMDNGEAKVGSTVRLASKIKNKTAEGIPSTIAIIGIPAGLSVQPWQLKELQEQKVFDFYEIKGNKLVVYYRGFAANETKELNLDLKAEIPGEYEPSASCAYLYYTNEFKSWNAVSKVKISG